MHKAVDTYNPGKAVDGVQERLTSYACGLDYDGLSPEAIHTAKARVIDTLGGLIGGFHGEPCAIARNLAAGLPNPCGASIIGTRMKTTVDMAAFVNGVTARCAEINDTYNWPGSYTSHPSDVLVPVLTAAEHAQAHGREFITGVVLAYEVFQRLADVFPNRDFDNTNFCCIGTAVAAGKLLGLTPAELAHCISMAVVPNNILRQVRLGHMSMWKTVAAGYMGRAGVFAALLARAGMEGPHLPFEGKAGWCEHIARKCFSLDTLGGGGTRFKILDSHVKNRPSNGSTLSSILAAEKVAPIRNIDGIERVTVEVYEHALRMVASGAHHWNPESRAAADHSIPYNVAATLMDGTITLKSFNEAHLWNPQLRALMQKIEVVENPEFTQANLRAPVEHRSRVTVVNRGGERLIGESGGDADDLSSPKTDAQIVAKFRGFTEDALGAKRVNSILDLLWHLDEIDNVARIPRALVFN